MSAVSAGAVPRLDHRSVTALLADCERPYAFIIGGGGKTGLLAALARHRAQRDRRRVAWTTTTRIRRPPPHQAPPALLGGDPLDLARRARRLQRGAPDRGGVTVLAARDLGGGKLAGLPPATLDRLYDRGPFHDVLVEADGSAGRSVKAHASWEPVISARANLVVAVMGLEVLGRPATPHHVHRCPRFCARLGLAPRTPLRPAHLAEILLAPRGYLQRVPPGARVVVYLSHADRVAPGTAERVAARIRARDPGGRVAAVYQGGFTRERPGGSRLTPGRRTP